MRNVMGINDMVSNWKSIYMIWICQYIIWIFECGYWVNLTFLQWLWYNIYPPKYIIWWVSIYAEWDSWLWLPLLLIPLNADYIFHDMLGHWLFFLHGQIFSIQCFNELGIDWYLKYGFLSPFLSFNEWAKKKNKMMIWYLMMMW